MLLSFTQNDTDTTTIQVEHQTFVLPTLHCHNTNRGQLTRPLTHSHPPNDHIPPDFPQQLHTDWQMDKHSTTTIKPSIHSEAKGTNSTWLHQSMQCRQIQLQAMFTALIATDHSIEYQSTLTKHSSAQPQYCQVIWLPYPPLWCTTYSVLMIQWKLCNTSLIIILRSLTIYYPFPTKKTHKPICSSLLSITLRLVLQPSPVLCQLSHLIGKYSTF